MAVLSPVKLNPIAAIVQNVVIKGNVPSIILLRPNRSMIKTLHAVPTKFVNASGMFNIRALSYGDTFEKVMPDFSIIRGP